MEHIELNNTSTVSTSIEYKTIQTNGFLSWEYNPLYNFRYSGEEIKYKKDYGGRYLIYKDNKEVPIDVVEGTPKWEELKGDIDRDYYVKDKLIIEAREGDLLDLNTEDLNFDINHPVDIEIQESYDRSVNLILNDNINPPKLINSRFTVEPGNKYSIIDRQGTNDSNIYTKKSFNTDTSLYKISTKISNVEFVSVLDNGMLSAGNYVFYFKYADSDNNETDFVAESGIVSVFMGNSTSKEGVKGGVLNENCKKAVRLKLSNTDTNFNYVYVYYSRSYGNKTELVECKKILTKYPIKSNTLDLIITGLEPTQEISVDQLNIQYNIASRVKSQAQVQNRLFFGNVSKPKIDYENLTKYSLGFKTSISKGDISIGYVKPDNYVDSSGSYEYYNPYNIYYHLGYWPEEIYRFGVVYIMDDYTLSPVFNILGTDVNGKSYEEDEEKYYKNLIVDDFGFVKGGFSGHGIVMSSKDDGVINSDGCYPYCLKITVSKGLIEDLKDSKIKGFFFVRQKRLPIKYCQGVTIATDGQSHLPMLFEDDGGETVFTESFISSVDRTLIHDYNARKRTNNNPLYNAVIIPDAALDSEYYSQILSGLEYNIELFDKPYKFNPDSSNSRHFYLDSLSSYDSSLIKRKLQLIPEDSQFRTCGTGEFSSRGGEAETAYKCSCLGNDNKSSDATNLLRGVWGTYVGMGSEISSGGYRLINILSQDRSDINRREAFKLRSSDTSPFYAISERFSIDDFRNEEKDIKCYRGDCFINTYTHRMVRNFQDPDAPTNDVIVQNNTWAVNYSGNTSGSFDLDKCSKINRSDVNAVRLGHWITFKFLSNINYATRCEDGSNISETLLFGHPRTFYPASPMSEKGNYKIPDSTLYNAGYNSTTSDKYNFIVPDVPYIKDSYYNRIQYSNIHISDAFTNNYRVFEGLNYKDYTIEFGYITKIVQFYSHLIVIFEHGIGLLSVNERVQMQTKSDAEVFLNASDVLPSKPHMLSRNFGSQWSDSIIVTERYVYGVDTVGKKIWRTNGQTFEVISDFKLQKYLNDNITLSERELDLIIGIRNVKTHFNTFKSDVIFTFYDNCDRYDNMGKRIDSVCWSLVFNELLNLWTTRYSWTPLYSGAINNIFFSYDLNAVRNISGLAQSRNSKGLILKDPGITTYNVDIPGLEIPVRYTSDGIDIPFGEGDLLLISKIGYNEERIEIKNVSLEFKDTNNSLQLLHPNNKYLKIEQAEKEWKLYIKREYKESLEKYLSLVNVLEFKLAVNISKSTPTTTSLGINVADITEEKTLYLRLSHRDSTSGDRYNDNGSYLYRHGEAGIFDETEKILPCRWYGRDHNFEFEFIVNDNVGLHKIFNNLDIISNNVAPDEIEYEIIGDCFEFADVKEDSYIYQTGKDKIKDGVVIEFVNDPTFKKHNPEYREDGYMYPYEWDSDPYVETEFYRNPDLNNRITFKRRMEIKDVKSYGRLKGNMEYREDVFDIVLAPIKYIKRVFQNGEEVMKISEDPTVTAIKWPENVKHKIYEIRPKDKFIKFRVRYKGNKLAIITALQTFYNISYS